LRCKSQEFTEPVKEKNDVEIEQSPCYFRNNS